MNLLRLSIHQTYANIAISTQSAQINIQSPSGVLQIDSNPSILNVSTDSDQLNIDSSRAWMALGKGDHSKWLRMISSQIHQEFLINVARIVEAGNKLADFTNPSNSIANIMRERSQEQSTIQYNGEASSDNVDVQYSPAKVNMYWTQHETKIRHTPQKPQMSYQPGDVNVYLVNQSSIEMSVRNYDVFG